MTLEEIAALTDAEVEQLLVTLQREHTRRWEAARAAEAIDAALTAAREGAGVDPGGVWVEPTSAVDAYPIGWEVVHNGKRWVSLIPGNVHAPGLSGWREVTDGAVAEWVQPAGAHDAYPLGARVTHLGRTWRSLVPANVWAPGTPGLWIEETD